jgi:ATP/maltotriose-dependent transcriptional regulator MalT
VEAEKSLKDSITAYEASRPSMVQAPLVLLAELRRRQGRAEESHRLLDRSGVSAKTQLCRANLALDRGDVGTALDLARRVGRDISPDRPLERVPLLDFLARALIASGDLDAAAAVLDELRGLAHVAGTTALRARMMHLEGTLAAASGDYEAAMPKLEDAIDVFEQCRAPFDAARARIELASTLALLGRETDAQREARQAHDCLRELGAVVDSERARRLANDADAGDDSRLAGVSRREGEVLRLLTQGLTNRQISERLFISEHTVHRHVTSILRKLDVPSRAAAAAYAVRAGLLDDRNR